MQLIYSWKLFTRLLILCVLQTCVYDVTPKECSGEHCGGDLQHEKEKYTSKGRWQPYLDLISQAVAEYKPCSEDCYLLQRRSDFRYWVENGGIQKEDFEAAKGSGEHYQIIDHKLYRQTSCTFPARCSGNEHFILKIIKQLPDMEMVINSHDWPRVFRYLPRPRPVLSFSKSSDERDILYPAWTFWEGGPAVSAYPTGIGRWDLMITTLNKAAEKWPWENKINKGFFRGSRTSEERDPLVLLSRSKPDLVDAQYIKNQAWKSEKDTLHAPPAEVIPMDDHCQYKYLYNFRGVAASFRFKHLFLCDSLVFHVGEEWIEFFYGSMKPWVHYIPLPTDLSNAEELLQFARENDDVVREIAARGRAFIAEHLRMRDIEYYWLKVLKRYAQLAKWKPVLDLSLKRIFPKD